jgi:hemolysin activation/secretion protein
MLPVSREGLSRLGLGVRSLLSQAGYPFSIVSVPPQDITDGLVKFVVTVSRLDDKVEVVGARHFSPRLYQAAIRLQPGEPLNRSQLNADIDWINRNPFRAARASVKAGAEPGTSQVLLQVNERLPWRFFTGSDNTGTESTKVERFYAGVNWGNAWGLGHQLTAQWNSSWDFETMRSGSGSYSIDLPWRHTLSVSGAYSRINGFVAPPFSLQGTSWQVALNYDIPPIRLSPQYSHGWQFGFDFKSSDNNFTFASVPITDNLTHVVQARISYSGQLNSFAGFDEFSCHARGFTGRPD